MKISDLKVVKMCKINLIDEPEKQIDIFGGFFRHDNGDFVLSHNVVANDGRVNFGDLKTILQLRLERIGRNADDRVRKTGKVTSRRQVDGEHRIIFGRVFARPAGGELLGQRGDVDAVAASVLVVFHLKIKFL